MDLGLGYWHRFKTEFVSALGKEESGLANAWSSNLNRTNFYLRRVLPHVSKAMGLDLRKEVFRRDLAMSKKATNGRVVPLIFIESENVARSADDEVQKLCALSAPLKVLITTTRWDESAGIQPRGGFRGAYMRSWREIIQAHDELWQRPDSVVGFLVGEWRKKERRFYLKFHGFAYDQHGKLSDKETVLFHKDMGQQAPPAEAVTLGRPIAHG